MKKTMSILTFAVLALATSISNAATRSVSLNHLTGWYSQGQRLTHNFSQPTFVEKLHIDAIGSRSFQDAQVYADGEFVGNMGVPGRDPYYPIIVRKKVQNIMIVFNGSIQIQSLSIDCNESPFQSGLRSSDDSTPAGLAESVLNVVAALQTVTTQSQFNSYLLPLRKAAIRMAASGGGRPLLSTRTQARAVVMINAINSVEGFLDELTNNTYYVDSVQTLMFVKERLQSMYEIN